MKNRISPDGSESILSRLYLYYHVLVKVFLFLFLHFKVGTVSFGQCRQLKQIAEAIYEALPQTPLLFLSQKEAKKLLKHKNFASCGK